MISEGDFHGPRPLGREFQEFFTAPGLGDDLGILHDLSLLSR